MTISSTIRKAGPFPGNGSTVALPFTFKVFTAADVLAVRAVTATGAETVLTLGTDYTVALNADQNTTPGGTLTLASAHPTGTTVTLASQVTNTQGVDLTNLGGFYPKVINDALDRATIQIQQLAEKVSRSLLSAVSAPTPAKLPAPAATKVLAWNAAGTDLENVDMIAGQSSLADLLASDAGADSVGFGNSTAGEKLREWVSPFDFGAVGNANASGSAGTNDTAAFVLLEAEHTNKVVNLAGRYYLVTSVPTKNHYVNGKFVVAQSTTDDQPANFAMGPGAFQSNTFIPRQHPSSTLNFASGNFNTAFGDNAMANNTTGRRNTAVGSQALFGNTTGYYNTAVGAYVLFSCTSGLYNTAIGNQAMQYLTTGESNVGVGNGALVLNTNGSFNTAVGDSALTKTVNRSIAIGHQAASSHTGNDSIAIGYQALSAPTSSGLYNVMIGSAAGGNLTTGNSNVGVGRRALSANQLGVGNTAVGNDAMVSATGGDNNTVMGSTALPVNTTGTNNVAIGTSALTVNTTGNINTAVGRFAAQANTTGIGNTAIGEQALPTNTVGNYNTSVGKSATSGGTNFDNTSSFGYQAACTGSNQVQLGNSLTTTYVYGTVQNRSDARDKADIRDTVLGLDFINALRPVDWRWDLRDDYFDLVDEEFDVPEVQFTSVGTGVIDQYGREYTKEVSITVIRKEVRQVRVPLPKDGSKKRGRYHHGLCTQDVIEACEKLGVDFGGLQDHSLSGGGDVMSLGYDELIGPLARAVQELSAQVQALKAGGA